MNILHICATVTILVAFMAIRTHSAYNQDGAVEIQHDLIKDCASEAKQIVDKAYKDTRTNLKARAKRSPGNIYDLMAYSKQAVSKSRNAIRAADYMAVTLQLVNENLKKRHPGPCNVSDVLTNEQKEMIAQLSGCAYQFLPKICTYSPYRSITGECNNIENPSLGASNTAFKRLLPPEYEDGVSLPRGWTPERTINGFTLPLARAVSNEIVSFPTEELTLDTNRSLIFMQFGQWTDHDMVLPVVTPSRTAFFEGTNCDTSCVKSHPCFPLPIPPNDPRITNRSDCIPLFRSAPACNLVSPLREQINVITSYVDGSPVYGSEEALAKKIRNNTNQLGLMAINQNFTDNGLPLLPFNGNGEDICSRTNSSVGIPCFLAGDIRSSEQPGITTLHTLFVREHNRIATQLHNINPHWSGETLYQETRKIVGGMLQKITFQDWVPLLLGDEYRKVLPPYKSYNCTEDPRGTNAFSFAFRMGHTLVQPLIYRLAEGYTPYNPEPAVPLHKTFLTTWRFVREGGIDPPLRGLIANRAKLNRQNQAMVDELRDRLFKFTQRIALDLSGLNIQRGRDHGIPGYNAWRRYCNLSEPKDVNELATVLNNRELAQKFINLYGTPKNIDLWIGAVSEPLVPNGRIGKLLSCLIGNQFRWTRDGDRYYYKNHGVFSPAQRKTIEDVTLAGIICENTGIKEVPRNVFLGNDYPQDFVSCSSIKKIDLSPWKDTENHSSEYSERQ